MLILIAPAFAIPVAYPSKLGFAADYVSVSTPIGSAVTIAGVTTRCTDLDADTECWFEAEPGDPLAIHGRGRVTWGAEDDPRLVRLDCTEAACVPTLQTRGRGDEGDAWLLAEGRGTLDQLDALIAVPERDVLARLWRHANEEALATLAACETCGTAQFDAGLALTRDWAVSEVDRELWDTAGFTAALTSDGDWTGTLDCFNLYGDCGMHTAGCELVVRRGGVEVLRYRDQDGSRLVTLATMTAGDDLGGGRVRGGAAATRW